MIRPFLALALVYAAPLSLFAQVESNVRPLSAPDDTTWTIRWDRSDDFNGDAVDWKKWHLKPEKFFAWSWDNERNTEVSEGSLKITARQEESKALTSAMLKSYATGTYGYYEARIRGADIFPGVSPAFWMYSQIDDTVIGEGEVRYSEVDVVELTQRGPLVEGNERITDHNLHAILSNGKPGIPGRDWRRPNDSRYQATQANEYHAPFDPRTDFHTYGCEVGKEEIVWFVDGVEIGRKPNEFWHRKMNVALSMGFRAPFAIFGDNRLRTNPDADASELPVRMIVDYVRVWERAE